MSDWQELQPPGHTTNGIVPQRWYVIARYSADCLLNNSLSTAPLKGVGSYKLKNYYFASELEAYMHLSNYYNQYSKLNPYVTEWTDAIKRAVVPVTTAVQQPTESIKETAEQQVMEFI